MQINFSDHESYHTVPLSSFTTTTAEQQLPEDRKKYLRSIAKTKSGQSAGPGVLSTASKNVYSKLVKQAAIKKKWLESKEMDAASDTKPLSDVEYDDQPGESDAGGETPGGSLAAAGAGSQKRTQTQDHTPPPPPKRQKKQEYPELIDVLNSFDLPTAQLEFTFEELFKATNMRSAKLKLTDWMLVMCKLSEVQMNSKLDAVAEEAVPLKEQMQRLVDEKQQQQETIEQQKSVISGINALLKESSK